jgi:hypothetical protein
MKFIIKGTVYKPPHVYKGLLFGQAGIYSINAATGSIPTAQTSGDNYNMLTNLFYYVLYTVYLYFVSLIVGLQVQSILLLTPNIFRT